ncbi:MAG: prolipoprotein diacylglyceryl transferase family protein, partial [Dehalococcoidia bacterium]
MYPVLIDLFGVSITSYGASKVVAALAAMFLLSREFRRLGWDPDVAFTLVLATTLLGFLGGKHYYLAEHAGEPMA